MWDILVKIFRRAARCAVLKFRGEICAKNKYLEVINLWVEVEVIYCLLNKIRGPRIKVYRTPIVKV